LILAVASGVGRALWGLTRRETPRPTLTVEYSTEAERLILERAIAFVAELRRLAQDTPGLGRLLGGRLTANIRWGTLVGEAAGVGVAPPARAPYNDCCVATPRWAP
jgi:hypothetical protein